MLPQMSMQISAAENAASVFVDGVELHAGGKEYFKNGDTADSGATGTYEDHSAYYDTAGELWLNNLEAHTIKEWKSYHICMQQSGYKYEYRDCHAE